MRFDPEKSDVFNNGLELPRNLLNENIKSKYPWIS